MTCLIYQQTCMSCLIHTSLTILLTVEDKYNKFQTALKIFYDRSYVFYNYLIRFHTFHSRFSCIYWLMEYGTELTYIV